MKTARLLLCSFFVLLSLGVFVPRAEAQTPLPDNDSTGFAYNYFYWNPLTPTPATNDWHGDNWGQFYPSTFHHGVGIPDAQQTSLGGPLDAFYAVFWDELNTAATSNAYHTIEVDSDIGVKGLFFRGQGWNIQDSDQANSITLFSARTYNGGVEREAITLDTGSVVTISAHVILGASDFPNLGLPSATSQTILMHAGSKLTLSGTISEAVTEPFGEPIVPVAKTLIVQTGIGAALTLAGNNTFSGGLLFATTSTSTTYGTTITPRLNLNNDHALGSGTLTIIGSGIVTLGNTSGTAVTITNQLILNVPTGTTGGYYVNNIPPDTQSLAFAGNANLTLTGDLALSGHRAIYVENEGGALVLSGSISNGSATSSLFKSGPGTLVLSASNTYTGATQINGGVLEVSHLANAGQASSIGASTSTSASNINGIRPAIGATVPNLVLSNGGTLRYVGAGDSTDRLIGLFPGQVNFANPVVPDAIDASGSGALKFTNTGSVALLNALGQARYLVLTGTNTDDNTFSLSLGDSQSAGSQILRGNNQLIKNGTGTWIASGNNTYTGGTIVNSGRLILTGTNTFVPPTTNTSTTPGATTSSGPGTYTVNGGTLQFGKTASFYNSVIDASTAAKLTVASGATATFNIGGTGEFTSADLTTLSTSGSFAAGSTLGLDTTNASGGTYTVTGNIGGSLGISKVGAGTLVLSASNTYIGGTTIDAGTLKATNASAMGGGTVRVDGGVFIVETSAAIANEVVLSGGEYQRVVTGNLAHAADSTSDLGGRDTAAEILEGTLTAGGTLTTSFHSSSSALNDEIRLSDVYSFQGTGSDVFVLQLSLTSVDAGSFLGWLNTSTSQWVNAVAGNTGGTLIFAGDGAYDPGTDFHLGTYGVDTANGTVWAVLNHNSDFAIVPEPSIGTLLILGGLGCLAQRRRRETGTAFSTATSGRRSPNVFWPI